MIWTRVSAPCFLRNRIETLRMAPSSKSKGSSPEDLALSALKHSAAGLAIFDFADEKISICYLNAAFYQILHQPESQTSFYVDHAMDSVHPEDLEGLLQAIKQAIQSGQPLNYRYRVLDGTGHYVWVGLKAQHEKKAAGVERFYGTYYDVNDFVEDQNKVTAILQNVPAGLALMTLGSSDLECQFANDNFFLAHHWTRAFFKSYQGNLLTLIHPSDRPNFVKQIHALRENGVTLEPLVYRSLGTEGNYHGVSTRASFAYSEGGRPTYYLSSVNLDKRIAAEARADRVNRMYESATEDMKLLVWDYDLANHRAILMEKGYAGAVARKYGVPNPVEGVPESLLPYVYEEDRPAFLKAYRDIEGSAEESHAEFRFQLPNQPFLQYEQMSFKKIRGNDGELIGILGSGQNITAMRVANEKYEKALAALQGPEYYASFRLDFDANLCWNGTLGKSAAKNVNVKDLEASGTVDGYFAAFCNVIADPEVQADFKKRFRRELIEQNYERGQTSIAIDYPFLYKNGERHWRRGTVALMRNPRNGHLEGVAYSTDIDGIKRSEFLLNNLNAHHFGYIGLLNLKDQTFEFISKDQSVHFGEIGVKIPYSDCLVYTRTVLKNPVTHDPLGEGLSIEEIEKRLAPTGTFAYNYSALSPDGPRTYSLRYSWFEKPGGDVLIVRSDITEASEKEKTLIQELNEAKQSAESANLAKTAFLSQMSHDIRTPLNGIIGLTYLLKEMDLPAPAKDSLDKIDTSSKFLLGLINDILDLSKAESGKLELNPEPYSPEEFERYVNAVASPLFASRYQHFVFKGSEPLHDRIPLIDKLRLNQIVFNLLSNASKYSPEGATIIYQAESIPLPKNRMLIKMSFVDHGIGMSEEFQAHLFEPFHQERGSDKAEMRGSGLGLAITKRLVDAMGGTIAVESKLGVGSTFALELSFDCVDSAKLAHQEKEQAATLDYTRLAGKHILLCEDNAINSEIAQRILREKGLLVTVAMDGKTGLHRFEESSHGYYSLILMDIRMPVMDGIEASKAIRSLSRPEAQSIPIIAMTADVFNEDVARFAEAGINDHLSKPIEPDKVFQMLLRYIH
jgi:signal transduction histidine kinase/PAS domain-containing protein/ActR/RegA family two-component response regulator